MICRASFLVNAAFCTMNQSVLQQRRFFQNEGSYLFGRSIKSLSYSMLNFVQWSTLCSCKDDLFTSLDSQSPLAFSFSKYSVSDARSRREVANRIQLNYPRASYVRRIQSSPIFRWDLPSIFCKFSLLDFLGQYHSRKSELYQSSSPSKTVRSDSVHPKGSRKSVK